MQTVKTTAPLKMRKRIGSTVYVTNVYFKNDAAETMNDKIMRLLKMAADGEIIHLEIKGTQEMIRLLSNATNNINQIAKRVNETGNFYTADLEDLREKYDGLWTHMKEMLRKFATI